MKQLKNEAEQKRKAAMQKELERQQAFLQVWSAPLSFRPLLARAAMTSKAVTHTRA
jgi:hypothetical protein